MTKKVHPLILHFLEAHNGEKQTILMRVMKSARTALERQVWESVCIDRLSGKEEGCLNLKSEWGLSQAPSLQNKTKMRSKAPPTTRNSGQKRGGPRKDT